jgi:hypothetical protein
MTHVDEDASGILNSLSSESLLHVTNHISNDLRKRKLQDEDGNSDSDDDYSRFKRIRLIETIERFGNQSQQHMQGKRAKLISPLPKLTVSMPAAYNEAPRYVDKLKVRFIREI